MKLLICPSCSDVFKLSRELRTCECGKVKGRYINIEEAEVNGEGFSLAIGNGSLISAIHRAVGAADADLDREDFINVGKVHYCWVRPHEGPGNPHTKVNPAL